MAHVECVVKRLAENEPRNYFLRALAPDSTLTIGYWDKAQSWVNYFFKRGHCLDYCDRLSSCARSPSSLVVEGAHYEHLPQYKGPDSMVFLRAQIPPPQIEENENYSIQAAYVLLGMLEHAAQSPEKLKADADTYGFIYQENDEDIHWLAAEKGRWDVIATYFQPELGVNDETCYLNQHLPVLKFFHLSNISVDRQNYKYVIAYHQGASEELPGDFFENYPCEYSLETLYKYWRTYGCTEDFDDTIKQCQESIEDANWYERYTYSFYLQWLTTF